MAESRFWKSRFLILTCLKMSFQIEIKSIFNNGQFYLLWNPYSIKLATLNKKNKNFVYLDFRILIMYNMEFALHSNCILVLILILLIILNMTRKYVFSLSRI